MRKSRFCLALLASFLVTGVSVPGLADQAIVIGNEVNVRTGPGTAYAIFSSLSGDMEVEVLNRTNPDWYLVGWEGSSGYVSSQYLELEEDNSSASITISLNETPGYINGMYVCLRSEPNASSTILGTYSTGKPLTITGTAGTWTAVRIDDKDGFVFRQFVSEDKPNSADIDSGSIPADSGVSPTLADFANQKLIVQSGSTVFTVRESPAPFPEEPQSPEYIVQVPTDGVSYAEPAESLTQPLPEFVSAPAGELIISSEASSPAPASGSVLSPLPDIDESAPVEDTGVIDQPVTRLAQVTGNVVRLRSGPDTTYSIIGTYDNGTEVVISGTSGDWTAVTIAATGVSGFIHSDYIESVSADDKNADLTDSSTLSAHPASFKITDGYITGSSVRLRDAPSMSARVLDELNFGTAVRMVGISDNWFRVIVNGKEGYVSASFVAEGSFEPAAQLSEATGTELGKEIAAYALQYVGTPYKWGGQSPESGFDCSGFVQYVYGQFGYTTSRVANDALSDGVHVDPVDLQPGDLLCFYSGNNYVGHLGIYVGDDMFVHAANSATGVVTTTLATGYYATRGYEIRRIV